jgi:hypothetical protein
VIMYLGFAQAAIYAIAHISPFALVLGPVSSFVFSSHYVAATPQPAALTHPIARQGGDGSVDT